MYKISIELASWSLILDYIVFYETTFQCIHNRWSMVYTIYRIYTYIRDILISGSVHLAINAFVGRRSPYPAHTLSIKPTSLSGTTRGQPRGDMPEMPVSPPLVPSRGTRDWWGLTWSTRIPLSTKQRRWTRYLASGDERDGGGESLFTPINTRHGDSAI